MNLPPLLSIRGATISFAKKTLFENLNLNLFPQDRICLIGKNGVGKTTLMNAIAGNFELDTGERWIKPNAIIGYLTQNEKLQDNITVYDFIKKDIKLDESKDYLIDIVCENLKIEKTSLTNNLSGGQKRRVNLAKALVLDPEILLLDEPTNHLDLEVIQWLEEYLKTFKGSIIVISHDRKFLEKISNKVFWIRAGQIKINNYGYKNFDEWSQNIIDHEARELENLRKKVELESGWLQTGVTGRRKRNIGRLHHLLELRNKLEKQKNIVFANQNKIKLEAQKLEEDAPQVIMSFNNVSYNANKTNLQTESAIEKVSNFLNKSLIKDFSLKILRGEKIGVIGRNGIGKSTLLKLMIGEIAPTSGTVKPARDISISYFDQSRSMIHPKSTIQEILCGSGSEYVQLANGRTRHICGYLSDFMFDPKDTQTLAGTLSGGQQNRLLLAKTLANPGNFMILDEPTNDLDMDSLDILEDYLEKYLGTLIVVSHDRDFLDNVATSILGFEGEGLISQCLGGYSEYISKNQKKSEQKTNHVKKYTNDTKENFNEEVHYMGNKEFTKSSADKSESEIGESSNKSKLSYKEKFELEKLPDKISRLEEKIQLLSKELSETEDKKSEKLMQVANEISKLQHELEKAEERWFELEAF